MTAHVYMLSIIAHVNLDQLHSHFEETVISIQFHTSLYVTLLYGRVSKGLETIKFKNLIG